jgi:hypothetical protein
MRILIRNRDAYGDPLGIIESDHMTPQMIIDIMDDVARNVPDYSIDDVIERLPLDCIWIDINCDTELYF